MNTSPAENWFNDVILENILLGALIKLQAINASEIKKMMEFIISLAQDEQQVGKSHEMMASQRLVKFYETEYCFPIEQAQDVFDMVESVTNHYAASDIFYANFPSEVRFIRGDKGNLLTPTLGRGSVFFAVQSHPAYGSNYLNYFKAVEQEFIKLGGLPHWGKLYFENPLVRHPNAEAFENVRKHYDPNGKFLNPFLQKLVNGESVG